LLLQKDTSQSFGWKKTKFFAKLKASVQLNPAQLLTHCSSLG
jgi:hypothetical protein